MATSISFHNVTDINAEAGPTRGAPLSIDATDAKGHKISLTLFLGDHALAIRLAAAINDAMAAHAPDAAA